METQTWWEDPGDRARRRVLFAPSVLGADPLAVGDAVDSLKGRHDWLHLDIMDGHFVRNLSFGPAMARMLDPRRSTPVRAGEVMSVAMPRVTPETPVAALLPMMAEGSCDAVPVLARGRIVGIVTRTDLIAALARQSLRATD